MVQHKCPKCGDWVNSMNAYYLHLLGQERCFKDGVDIADKMRGNILKIRGQVEYLLMKIPGTRGDDSLLHDWWLVIFKKAKVYNYETHQFEETRGRKPGERVTKQDTLGRARRDLQKEDRELYHDHINTNIITIPHLCIQATTATQLKRQILYEEHTRYYGMKDTVNFDEKS